MKKFYVPIRWQAVEMVEVEADNLAEAIEKASNVPTDFSKVSFDCPEINEDEVEEEEAMSSEGRD